MRKVKAAGFVEKRKGKGSHVIMTHPRTGQIVVVCLHAKQDAGRLGNVILKKAGLL